MADTEAPEPLKPGATTSAPHAHDIAVEFEASGDDDIDFVPAEPLKQAAGSGSDIGATDGAAQALKDGAAKLTSQATDRARAFADQGKAKASDLLDELTGLLKDAAGQLDDRVGPQFGQYAHTAADTVSGYADSFKAKDVDELVDDARGFVRNSPAIAIGAAAAVGFVLARLVKSGIEATKSDVA